MGSIKKRTKSKPTFMNNIMDDVFHPNKPICQLLRTSNQVRKQDIFDEFRPQKGACVDYNISQTDTKIDAGDTKIHVQQTEAEYFPYLSEVPPPPKPKKIRYSSGGPPCWEFLEEIRRRKMEELQQRYHIEFAKRVTLRKKTERANMLDSHNKVLAFVGPAWYQELSPKQIAVVNDLQNCMEKDFRGGTTDYTQDNIGRLGVYLRPNHRYIEKALKNCCRCPVEFLLILYQIINPKRKRYSINDRLLLSAVVHLTLKSTLRELHIRIPSPPPPQKVVQRKSVKKKRVKYDSPYLEPYSFEREPPKFSGLYYNKHVQRPESPYFSYLEKLRKDIEENNNLIEESSEDLKLTKALNRDLIEETELAQSMYERLVEYKPVPRLLKPSRYRQCYNFRNTQILLASLSLPPIPHSLEDEVITCVCQQDQLLRRKLKAQLDRIKVRGDAYIIGGVVEKPEGPLFLIQGYQPEIKYETGRKKKKKKKMKDLLELPIRKEQTFIIGGVTETAEGSTFIISGLQPEVNPEPCTCAKDYELLRKRKELIASTLAQENRFILGGVANTPQGPMFVLSGRQPDGPFRDIEARRREDLVQAMIQRKKKFVIEGVVNTPDGPVFLLSRLQPGIEWGLEDEEDLKKDVCPETCDVACGVDVEVTEEEKSAEDELSNERCHCLEKKMKKEQEMKKEKEQVEQQLNERCYCLERKTQEEKEKEEKDAELLKVEPEVCECKLETQKAIDKPLCTCEKCVAERERKTTTYVIQGVKEAENESVIPVINAVIKDRPCKCLEDYDSRVEDYEHYQQRKQLVVSAAEAEDEIIVGGVRNTPEGPVFIHGGIQPQLECICAEKARELEAEKRHLERMPQPPPGRIKYGIGGVRETPQGNVYVINNALPIGECACMKLYDTFAQEHSVCLKMYNDYLKQMKEEIDEFLKEALMYETHSVTDEEAEEEVTEDKQQEVEAEKTEAETEEEEVKTKEKKSCIDVCKKKSPPPCTCGQIEPEEKTCGECLCGFPVEEDLPLEAEDEEEEQEPKLKRFFIYKKLLCKPKWQMNVLKKALKSMADDGYPLARLPDCHKLPYFRLWMQMRCGMYWTQEDRYKSILVSKWWWRHIDKCEVKTVPKVRLPITKQQANALTWSKAGYVKKLSQEAVKRYIRTVRKNMVNLGREFFPTTYEYEFPFHTYRDCFFAYIPAKEEECLASFVWHKHEYNNVADTRRCVC